jgi:hypothetical protein
MTEFSFEKLRVDSSSRASYTLQDVTGEPVLELAPATNANEAYMNGMLRAAGQTGRRVRRGKFDPALTGKLRDIDRKLYPKYVLKGWSGVVDAQGREAEFSEENAAAFLAALPDWIFDDVRGFASDPQSFLPEDEDPVPDVEELAGN